MALSPSSLSFAPQLPFEYVGGAACLDLVNTVDWAVEGLDWDRLSGYERLTRWAEGAGVVDGAIGERLRRGAEGRRVEADVAYREARWLRWVLRRVFVAVASGESAGSALDELNDMLTNALRRLELVPVASRDGGAGAPLEWRWIGMGERLDSVLWPVVRSAAELLASEEGSRVRVCGGAGCGWVYVDRSRNGMRRWCQMEVCGTREKSRRRAERGRGRAGRGRVSAPAAGQLSA